MMRVHCTLTMFFACIAGCGGDAGVELAASDALLAVADQMQLTVHEYHREVTRHDDTREDAAMAAFIARVQSEHDDAAAMQTHVREFRAALGKIREDRETEWQRQSAAMSNVGVLREIGSGLQKVALDSLSLRDEARRYLDAWIENQRRARTNPAAAPGNPSGGQAHE